MQYSLGGISGVHIFIDGTKIESAVKRYTFVWKKAVTKNPQIAYIKPNNYEQSKKSKYKNDIGRMENMTYDVEKDI